MMASLWKEIKKWHLQKSWSWKEKNLSQEEFAEKLDVSRQAVSKWESGTGYPETEKLLQISQIFNVSLDYLLLDDNYVEEKKQTEAPVEVHLRTGRIVITSHDKKAIVNCISVKSSQILAPGKNEPKYILYGVDRVTFWGENSTILGYYKSAENVQKEIEAINDAISQEKAGYELQYAANVEYVGFFQQPKIIE